MNRLALAALLATVATPLAAAPVIDAVKADMPSLMTLYKDLHANPELSMQEVRTPGKLAADDEKARLHRDRKGGQDWRRLGPEEW